MENIIIIAILAVILGGAAGYVYKEKKNGRKCIGCPGGCSCSSGSEHSCGCSGSGEHTCNCSSGEHSCNCGKN